jgi:hypothetical protein
VVETSVGCGDRFEVLGQEDVKDGEVEPLPRFWKIPGSWLVFRGDQLR